MTLNQLIKDATAISHKYTTADIPLMIYGKEVDIVLTEQSDNGHYYIEVNYVPTPKEKSREIIRQAVTPKETFDRLRQLKADLDKAVEEEKQRMKQ